MTKKAAGQSGFTLLEILIATGILAIGLVTVFSLFPIGIYAVKDAVERTRGASLAQTTRSELTAMRADMRILDGGSQHYADGYIPFGPWRYPGTVNTFRTPLYEYYRDDGGGPVLHRRIVFDERRMVPVTLTGTFNGSATITFNAAQRLALTRDSDRLEYYWTNAAGLNKYAPYDIYVNVQGQVLQILDRTYSSGAIYTAGANLATLTLAAPTVASSTYSFDILLPVALKEPTVDVPQEWSGGVANFTGGGPVYNVLSGTGTRNLARYLTVPGSGTPPHAWITIGGAAQGDWFEVSGVTRTGGMPDSLTLAGTPPAGGSATGDEFKICLPLAEYAAVDMVKMEGTFNITLDGTLLGGGGPQTNYLDTGAQIEILLDGAVGTFESAGTRTQVNIKAGTINGTTSGFITDASAGGFGNFIRVDGRDYEIADTTGLPASFEVFGSVPVRLNEERYFNIVLGYLPGQVPEVARFPVRTVTRPGVPPYGSRVTKFTIGPDANGNLPNVLGFTPVPGRVNPIHVLPRNHSQFASEVVMSQKSSAGIVGNDAGVPVIDAPTYDPPQLGPPPQASRIPYSSDIYQLVANDISHAYEVRVLYPPTVLGGLPSAELNDITSVLSDTPPADHTRLVLTSAFPLVPVPTGLVPVHILDKNQFWFNAAGDDLSVGQWTYDGNITFTFSGTPPPEAVFIAGDANDGVLVRVDASSAPFPRVVTVAADLTSFTIDTPPGVPAGIVTVGIPPYDPLANSKPLGRGKFDKGSAIVQSVNALTVAGFPYATSGAQRYHLAVGDWIKPTGAGGTWYAVKAIQKTATDPACIILDRPFEENSIADTCFYYYTPIEEGYEAQATVFRRYRIQALLDTINSRAQAAAFGFDSAGNVDPLWLQVHLAAPLPTGVKPGDYIRADGDADHAEAGGNIDRGLGDQIDGDWRWYMIDTISVDRRTLTLTSPYRGYVPATEAEALQPASVTSAIVRTFDTVIGAF